MSKEWRRITGILEILSRHSPRTTPKFLPSVGVSALDDCAVIPLGDLDLVIGSDFVRGEGFDLFRLGYLSPLDIGYYLIGANASDMAAMGASPIGVVVVFRYTPEMNDEYFLEVMEGVALACADLGITLLGGDTGGYTASVLSAAAIGVCPPGKALLRSKGKPGDILMLSGDVGTAGAARLYFTKLDESLRKLTPEDEARLLEPWKRVRPALKLGVILTEHSLSNCAIDTSDGLKVSCEQVASASGVDVILNPDAIPISWAANEVGNLLQVSPLEIALGDSVDFRLVFSVPQDKINELRVTLAQEDLCCFEIGYLAESAGKPAAYLNIGQELIALPGAGWIQ